MKQEKLCGIYMITSPDGKMYIGYSKNIYKRWNYYFKIMCKSQWKLRASFMCYGKENHKFEIIELCTEDKLREREVYYISFYDTYYGEYGLNLTIGGDGSIGYKLTEEQKLKSKGKVPWNKNKKMSDEYREAMRQCQLGQKQTPETIAKRSKSMIGKKLKKRTDEQRKAQSIRQTGMKQSINTCLKRSASMKGKNTGPKSDEAKKNISKGHIGQIPWNKGKKYTKEQIDKKNKKRAENKELIRQERAMMIF